jgi:hypothetical protein
VNLDVPNQNGTARPIIVFRLFENLSDLAAKRYDMSSDTALHRSSTPLKSPLGTAVILVCALC